MSDERKRILLLKLVGNAYETGDFEEVFNNLDENCVWESQWVLEPRKGIETLKDYYRKKAETIKNSNTPCEYEIVELVGNMGNIIDNVKVNIQNEETTGSVRLAYEEGKLVILITQKIDDKINGTIIDLKINENNKIERIDLSDSVLYNYKPTGLKYTIIEDAEDYNFN